MIDTADGPIDALITVPDGDRPWPAVVVVHDALSHIPDNQSRRQGALHHQGVSGVGDSARASLW
jgi:dienelactone hydrolase